jgi:probable rRNA maturation factor
MRRLNHRFRGRDYATDVLSFAYRGEVVEGLPYLGEIVIAPDVAAENAGESKVPVERELRTLLVHGVLHLLGYDHETDSGQMLRLQARLLRVPALAGVPLLEAAAGARRPASLGGNR